MKAFAGSAILQGKNGRARCPAGPSRSQEACSRTADGRSAQLTEISARLRVELEHKTSELRLLGAQNANLAKQAANLEREHHALLSSTSWRITEPLRKLKSKTMSGQRNQVRRALKAAWWAATPWRIPARLRFIRERNASSSTVGGAATILSAVQSPYLAWRADAQLS